jgi:hypothetical protein
MNSIYFNTTSWARRRRDFYSAILWNRKRSIIRSVEEQRLLDCPGQFPCFDKWNGPTFSQHYMTTVLNVYFNIQTALRKDGENITRSTFRHLYIQQFTAQASTGDARFKFVASICQNGKTAEGDLTSSKVTSLYSMLNEFGQVISTVNTSKVILSAPLANDNFRELKPAILHMLVTRFHGRGVRPPKLCYSDLCCEDRAVMGEIMQEYFDITGELCEFEGSKFDIVDDRQFAPFSFPLTDTGSVQSPILIRDPALCAFYLEAMKKDGVKMDERLIFGFDIEWRPYISNAYVLPSNLLVNLQFSSSQERVA